MRNSIFPQLLLKIKNKLSPFRLPILLIGTATLLLGVIALFPVEFTTWNSQLNDTFFKIRYHFGESQQSPYVFNVVLTDDDLKNGITGDEKTVTKIVAILNQAGVQGIVQDIFFESEANPVDLQSSIYHPDQDGLVRKIPLITSTPSGKPVPSLTLKTMIQSLSVDMEIQRTGQNRNIMLKNVVLPGGKTDDIFIPVDEMGHSILNYTAPWQKAYPFINFQTLLLMKEDISQLGIFLDGTFVILSDITSKSKDFGPGMFDPVMPLSMIHSEVVNSVLTTTFIRKQPLFPFFITITLSLLYLYFAVKRKKMKHFLLLSFGGFVVLFLNGSLLFIFGSLLTDFFSTALIYWGCFITLILNRLAIISAYMQAIEIEREEQKMQLLQANKLIALGTMASSIVHEIANPNTAVSNNIRFLSQTFQTLPARFEELGVSEDDEIADLPSRLFFNKFKQGLTGISESSRSISKILGELRNFYKNIDPALSEQVDITKIVASALFITAYEIRKVTNEPEIVYPADLPKIKGNSQQLTQVLVNLILNACYAIEEKSNNLGKKIENALTITVENNTKSNNLSISITDKGTGINPEKINLITKPFYTTRLESGGTGLGLHISHTIITRHQGTLEISSTPGHGTKVVVGFKQT